MPGIEKEHRYCDALLELIIVLFQLCPVVDTDQKSTDTKGEYGCQ